MSDRTMRRSSRRTGSLLVSSSTNSKKRNQPDTASYGSQKRQKSAVSNTPQTLLSKTEKLANIMLDFRLAVNESFQLREYLSLASWDPSQFSLPLLGDHVPPLYESFIEQPQNTLSWDPEIENDKSLMDLPIRLQKKVRAEINQKLLQKFPFKDDVIKLAHQKEIDLMNNLAIASSILKTEPIVEAKPKALKTKGFKTTLAKLTPNIKTSRTKPHIKSEIESDHSEDDAVPNDHIKTIKYSIPPQLITHPSHIPQWRLEPVLQDGSMKTQSAEIIDFHPKPIQITVDLQSDDRQESYSPYITERLDGFLDHHYKTPIIDESTLPEYGYTKDEYEKIMAQQEEMLHNVYEKTMVGDSMQLVGEKLELRKVTLPLTTNAKLTSDPFRLTGTVTPKVQGAANNMTFSDHLVNQGVAFSKIHQLMRKQHLLRARKVAQMIEQHFKKKSGEKERLAREQEQNLKKIGRLAVQAVKKRWQQVNKVYSHIQNEKEEEAKKIKGREHLSQMLEHSTQLLEAQLSRKDDDMSDRSAEEDSDDSNSDQGFSSSEDEAQGEHAQNGHGHAPDFDNDSSLTVEELKAKYHDMKSSDDAMKANGGISGGGEKENGEAEGQDKAIDVTMSHDETPEIIPEYSEAQLRKIEEINHDQETQTFSSETDSSMGSDSGSESDSESESNAEVTVINNGGLASLFASKNGHTDDPESEEDDSKSYHSGDESLTVEKVKATNEPAANDVQDVEILGKPHLDEHPDVGTNGELLDTTPPKEEMVNGAMVRDVSLPSLLRGTLRPYQKQGLNWLASLYNNNTNGILADEMGLGKTIQTISLLSYLACEHHIWGPHLIVVPTSVMLNWEMEFKKFAPGFKVMTYYGSPQQRAQKRKGWNKPNAFHVCITSYQLVVHDHQSFKRRKWRYMILDEAHNIKNFRSTRWKALLNFNTENRLLLTGTPLQNNLIELWSLLYFLMPSSKVTQAMPDGFANLDDFQTWFGRPVDKIMEQTSSSTNDIIDDNYSSTSRLDAETKNTISRLHQVLRPYLLRRLKKDVEKQMPGKYEHIVYCRLSKRQRYLYDDFMSRAKTKETLASGNFLSIINCLMQLRKVCNHPDLFEVRPILTSYLMPRAVSHRFQHTSHIVSKQLTDESFESKVNLSVLNLNITSSEDTNIFVAQSTLALQAVSQLQEQISKLDSLIEDASDYINPDYESHLGYFQYLKSKRQIAAREKLKHALYLNKLRCSRLPIYGATVLKFIRTASVPGSSSDVYQSFALTVEDRVDQLSDIINKYSVLTPPIVALDMKDQMIPLSTQQKVMQEVSENRILNPFHKSQVKLSIAFPDKSLLQYDCGKLQKLATLMQDLIAGGHRALIFTQMTKVLDILEQFLNIHGYRYMRLDGSTKIEDRQLLTETFNRDNRIPVFILSTRSGGLGINLTGADTVIFYDSDWNPAMDKQCQDRCHRIGQIRDVHIYRFVSEFTIESNILKKANQKRQLDNVVIQEGEFTTDHLGKFSVRDLVTGTGLVEDGLPDKPFDENNDGNPDNILAQAEDEDDRAAASAAMKETAVDNEDFDEENKQESGAPSQPQRERSETPVGTVSVSNKVGDNDVDADFEDGVGHIDEYMLRFMSAGYYFD